MAVHNIPESTLLKELEARQITIPPKPRSEALPAQVIECVSSSSRRQRRCTTIRTNVRDCAADAEQLQHEHNAYVAVLRSLLVERLKLEEEYERLQMYSRASTALLYQLNWTLVVLSSTCYIAPCA